MARHGEFRRIIKIFAMLTDYKIIESISRALLADKIKKLMKKGWQPIGGLDTRVEMGTQPGLDEKPKAVIHTIYAQAMVKAPDAVTQKNK